MDAEQFQHLMAMIAGLQDGIKWLIAICFCALAFKD